jgi:hypothetical protein
MVDDKAVEAMQAALLEARQMIVTVVSNAMILEIIHNGYKPEEHPVIKQIDAALAGAAKKEPPPSTG